MPDSEAKKAWIKAHTTSVGLKLNNRTDADILEFLREKESIQGYIKQLIRDDIARQKSK